MTRVLIFAVLPLAMFETLVWASMFYSFPALLPVWEADLGWSRAELSGALTASMCVTALASPRMGKLIDWGHDRAMLQAATVLGAASLFALSQVDQLWQFWAVWIAIGIVNACILYEACFAILTVTLGGKAKQAITVVTLVAGFAGTVCFPAFHLLSEAFGWRGALQVFACIMLFVCLPLATLGMRKIEPLREAAPPLDQRRLKTSGSVLQNPAFWSVALTFAIMGLVQSMIISHIRPILAEAGLALTTAVLIASLFGPMQVVGRIIMVAMGERVGTFQVAVMAFSGVIIGLAALLSGSVYPLFALIFVVPYSASYGLISIVRPVLAAEFLGRTGFGTTAGMLAMTYVFAGAAGPILSAGLWSIAGYDLVLGVCLALCTVAVSGLYLARRYAAEAA